RLVGGKPGEQGIGAVVVVGTDTVVSAAEQRVEHADVAAAVRAFADRDGDVLRRLPVGAQGQGGSGVLLGGGHAPYRCGLVLVRRGPRGFGDVKLEAAPAAGDRESVALPGGVGHQVVGELDSRGVAHQHRHVVFDGDAGAEDVEVAPVAVLVLSVQVELGEVRTVAQV